jgi:GxxExxY protein
MFDAFSDPSRERANAVSKQVLGAAIEVHRSIGPGLLESAYENCLCHEFHLPRIAFERQVSLPVRYKGVNIDCGYRLDIVVEKLVVVELKAVENWTRFTRPNS